MTVLRHKDGVRDRGPGRRNCQVFKPEEATIVDLVSSFLGKVVTLLV